MAGTELQNALAQLEKAAIGATSPTALAAEAARLGITIPAGMIEGILNKMQGDEPSIPDDMKAEIAKATIENDAKDAARPKADAGVTTSAAETPRMQAGVAISDKAIQAAKEAGGIV